MPSSNTNKKVNGLVQLDRTAMLYKQLQKKNRETNVSPRLWKSDWRK